jgi:hypothetical protein
MRRLGETPAYTEKSHPQQKGLYDGILDYIVAANTESPPTTQVTTGRLVRRQLPAWKVGESRERTYRLHGEVLHAHDHLLVDVTGRLHVDRTQTGRNHRFKSKEEAYKEEKHGPLREWVNEAQLRARAHLLRTISSNDKV